MSLHTRGIVALPPAFIFHLTFAACLIVASCLVLACSSSSAPEPTSPAIHDERLGYSIGYQVGQDFRRQAIDIEPEFVVEGVVHALAASETRFTASEMREALIDLGGRAEAMTPPASQ